MRVQLFPYICALLAIGVILVISKVIFNYWRRRHPVGEPSKAIQPDIGKGVNVSVNPAIGVVERGGGLLYKGGRDTRYQSGRGSS